MTLQSNFTHWTPRSCDCTDGSDSYEDDCSSECSEESASSVSGGDAPQLDLSLWRLQSLHASGDGTSEKITVYAQNGMSTTRIKTALKAPVCDCRCAVPAKLLANICKAFWNLRKETQDSLLWTLQMESGRGSKRTWSIGGSGLIHQSMHVNIL